MPAEFSSIYDVVVTGAGPTGENDALAADSSHQAALSSPTWPTGTGRTRPAQAE